jgi:2'-5' RNA ligase
MTDSVRSFVAVPLPEEIRTRILAAVQELARALPQSGIKWFRKLENLHITVKFLGQVEEAKLAALGDELAQALAPLPRFPLAVRRMGAFPSSRKANVVWAGVDDVGARGLASVAEAVEGVGSRLGFAREERPFTGHVTVGRSKGRGVDARHALDAFAERAFGDTTVDEVHLYESRLGGEGSTYVLRSRAALAAN